MKNCEQIFTVDYFEKKFYLQLFILFKIDSHTNSQYCYDKSFDNHAKSHKAEEKKSNR